MTLRAGAGKRPRRPSRRREFAVRECWGDSRGGGRYRATYAGLIFSTLVGVRLARCQLLSGRFVRLGPSRPLRLRTRVRLRGGDLRFHGEKGEEWAGKGQRFEEPVRGVSARVE